MGSIPESGRPSGERNDNQLLYSGLGNLMDRGAWRATVHGGRRVRRVRHDLATNQQQQHKEPEMPYWSLGLHSETSSKCNHHSVCVCVCLLSCYSCVWIFVILWTVVHQTSLWESRVNESHSVVSDSLQSHGQYSPWNSPSQNTGVGSLSLLQGIFLTQGSNPSSALQADSLPTELWRKCMRKQRFRAFKHPAQDHRAILFQFYLFIFCSVIIHHCWVQASHCRDYSCCGVWALGPGLQ